MPDGWRLSSPSLRTSVCINTWIASPCAPNGKWMYNGDYSLWYTISAKFTCSGRWHKPILSLFTPLHRYRRGKSERWTQVSLALVFHILIFQQSRWAFPCIINYGKIIMKHPIVIGIASIFPGLGYLLLGRYRHALYIFLFLISLCSLSVFLTEKAFYFFVVFWAVQIIFAVRTAQLEKSQGEENSLAPK